MKEPMLKNLLLLVLTCLALTGCASRIAQNVSHPFIVTDHSNSDPKVRIYTAQGELSWDYPCDSSVHDIWVLPSGNILFASKKGVLEVTPQKQIVFTYDPGLYITACQPLPDGKILVGENPLNRLVEVERSGKITKVVNLSNPATKKSHNFRLARKLKNGNYLVAHEGTSKVCEYAPNGQLLRMIAVPGTPYVAIRLANGNTLISCGAAAMVIEVDPQDKIVWQITNNDLPQIELKWLAGLQRLPNGNTVMTSWFKNADFKGDSTPQIIEVNPKKQVVWTFSDPKLLGSVNDIQLLDIKGNVEKYEIMR